MENKSTEQTIPLHLLSQPQTFLYERFCTDWFNNVETKMST